MVKVQQSDGKTQCMATLDIKSNPWCGQRTIENLVLALGCTVWVSARQEGVPTSRHVTRSDKCSKMMLCRATSTRRLTSPLKDDRSTISIREYVCVCIYIYIRKCVCTASHPQDGRNHMNVSSVCVCVCVCGYAYASQLQCMHEKQARVCT